MTESTATLVRADEDRLEYVASLLSRSDLPTEDVDEGAGQFYVARADGDRVGIGGLETHGSEALVRSVAVEPGRRGEGHGAAIVDALEATARDEGADRCFLLTTTAQAFFAARGYEAVDRAEAPEAIRSTTEFADLCPTAATVMRRSL